MGLLPLDAALHPLRRPARPSRAAPTCSRRRSRATSRAWCASAWRRGGGHSGRLRAGRHRDRLARRCLAPAASGPGVEPPADDGRLPGGSGPTAAPVSGWRNGARQGPGRQGAGPYSGAAHPGDRAGPGRDRARRRHRRRGGAPRRGRRPRAPRSGFPVDRQHRRPRGAGRPERGQGPGVRREHRAVALAERAHVLPGPR